MTCKKTWIKPQKNFWDFWMVVLDGFDVFKLYLHRLPAKSSWSEQLTFLEKIPVYHGGTPEGKKIYIYIYSSVQDICGWVTEEGFSIRKDILWVISGVYPSSCLFTYYKNSIIFKFLFSLIIFSIFMKEIV